MKFYCLIILILNLVSLDIAFAGDIFAELKIENEESIHVLNEGEVYEGVLKFWPIENADLTEFEKIDSLSLENNFVVSSVENIKISENNADVVEVKVLLVASPMRAESGSFSYKNQKISIKTPMIKFLPLNGAKDFVFMNQKTSKDYMYLLWGTVIGVLFVIALVVLRKKIKILLVNKNNNNRIHFIKKIFNEASERKQYELIYEKKEEWKSLIKDESNHYADFISAMEAHQYKKEWGEFEYKIVKEKFDNIRGSLL